MELIQYMLSCKAWKLLFKLPVEDVSSILKKHLRDSFFIPKGASIGEVLTCDVNVFLKRMKKDRAEPFFDFINKEFSRFDPLVRKKIVVTADEVCKHTFDLLGSGKVNLGMHINWNRDFKGGKIWENQHMKKIKYTDWYGGSDIKIPWELSRFHYVTTLGYAYWITKNEKYAKEFIDLAEDWISKNRVYYGINWRCTMDVAIRACNWILGHYFFKGSKSWTDAFSRKFFSSLADHGRFIYNNLEYGLVNNNHYLADIVGLIFLGVLFPEFKEAEKWKKKGILGIEKEMKKQVYEDGVDFEASIPYHRLATELFGFSALLCRSSNVRLSPYFLNKLEKMFEFIKYYTKPNGLAPQVGDNDDGRFFILEDDYASWDRRDHRPLLRLGSAIFPGKFRGGFNKLKSCAFHKSGIYIMRDDKIYCLIECSPTGQAGNGGHAHNDTLSFELNILEEDFIVDPGSYVYTVSPKERNKFRGTAMHNTVRVDRQEMNKILPDKLYELSDDAVPKVNKWYTNKKKDHLDAQHSGYMRLKSPLIHRRVFSFDKGNGRINIIDSFLQKQKKEHIFEWYFHLAPGVVVEKITPLLVRLRNKDVKVTIGFPENLKPIVKQGEYSPRYGVKVASKVLYSSFSGSGLEDFVFRISFA